MSNLTFDSKTRFQVDPYANASLLGISDDCLQLQSLHISLGFNFGFGGVLAFLFLGLPILIFILISPWLPPYGYNDDGSPAVFVEVFFSRAWLVYVPVTIIFGGLTLLMTYNYARIARNAATRRFSPITFNRNTKIVSAVFMGDESELACNAVRGMQHTRRVLGPALIPIQRNVIELEKLGIIEGDEALWEYIQVFMNEGPYSLTIPTQVSDPWEHQPLYSRTFKQALAHHRPWPIVKKPALGKYFSYFLWPFNIVLYIPFLLTEWFWRLMCKKAFKSSGNFPEQRLKKCGCTNGLITGQMATDVYQDAGDDEGINYLEVKRRLDGQILKRHFQ